MPKKFAGENTKSAVAKARKADAKEEADEKKRQAAEDALWQDDDKNNQRKMQRKEEQERKKAEAQERKLANKAAHDEEMRQLHSKAISTTSTPSIKVTQAQIAVQRREEQVRREEEDRLKAIRAARIEQIPDEIEDNVNRLALEPGSARNVNEAIQVLTGDSPIVDRHPEKRVKAAYQAFEDQHLPRLKADNPTLRLSQLKQMLKKEWLKSPDNPVNQHLISLNSP